MMMQKRSSLFRALLCSSALVGMASRGAGQDGVSRVGDDPGLAGPYGPDGVVDFGAMRAAQMPDYSLPQYFASGSPDPLYTPPRQTWQDQIGPRYRMETRIGEWLGSDDEGDAAVNVMLPFAFNNSNTILFIDARGTVTYQGGGAGSVGAGVRYYDEEHNRIFGLSGWYDYDNGNSRDFQQAGVSFESIGRWVDFRANGYFGLGNQTNILSSSPTGNATPDPNSPAFLVEIAQQVQSNYTGGNVEIGGPTPVLGRYGFETYVGGYSFGSEDAEDVRGVSVRSEAHVTDDLRLGINVTNDNTFDTTVYGTVVLQLPDGRPSQWFRPKQVRDKMLDRVERRYRTMTNTRTKLSQISTSGVMAPAASGSGGMITVNNVIFVNPNAATNGVGTFGNPYNTLVGFPTLSPNTLVIVRSGETQGSVGLPASSLLYSEAFINQNPLMLMTSFGPVMLPALSTNATAPTLSNPNGGPIVRLLGDNTEVAGLIFDGTTNAGPANNIIMANGVQGVSIHDNTFRNYNTALDLRNVTGTLASGTPTSIYSNNFFGATGLSFDGLRLENNGTGTLDLELGATEYNTEVSSGSASGNIAYGNSGEDLNGNGVLDAGEDRNGDLMLNQGAGFRVTAMNRATINVRAIGNTASAEMDINNDGTLNSEDINGNNVLDAGEDLNGNGMLDYGEDGNQNGRRDLGNGTGFVFNAGPTGSTINLAMIDNVADSNIGDGILLVANESIVNAGTLGEDVNGNGRLDGFEDVNRNGVLNLSEDRNGNGFLDRTEDVNGNGILDPTEDRDGDGILDPTEDLNGNGILDVGEDRNFNGRLDLSEDTNGNGVLDLAEDTNMNGVLDPAEDLNGNGVLDLGEDLDGDGVLDAGEDGGEDTNGNGMLDAGEDRNGDGFLNLGNGNGRLDGGYIFRGNQVTRNGRDGIRIDSTNNATVTLLMASNSVGSLADRSTGNRGVGLNVNADSGLFTAQLGFIYHEDVNLNGILDPGEDTNFNGVLDQPSAADGNQFVANAGGGAAFNLTGTAIGQVSSIGNTVVGIGGGQFDFTVAGLIDLAAPPSFNFQNSSGIGIDISSLVWDLNGAGLLHDPANGVAGTNGAFTALNSTDILTGLQSVNGNTNPLTTTNVASQLTLLFNSFNAVNGVLDGSEDLNANGILDAGEDANGNGVLDFGEDTNMNGRLDAGEDIPDILSFQMNLDQIGNPATLVNASDLIGSQFRLAFSHGQSLTGTMQAVPGNANAVLFVPDPANLGAANGLSFNVSQNAVLRPSTILANTISDFGGSGVFARATEEGDIQDLSIQFSTITGNGSNNGLNNFRSGITLQTGNNIDAILRADIRNNVISNNVLSGVDAFADGGTLTIANIQDNTLDANGQGVSLMSAQSGTLSARITDNTISNSVTTNGTPGHGVAATARSLSTLILGEISGNIINGNAGDGINLAANSNGSLQVLQNEDVNGNGVLDIGEDANEDTNGNGILDSGEDLNGDGFLNLGNGNGLFDHGVLNNNLNNNAGTAFNTGGVSGTLNLGTIANNVVLMNQSGTGGFAINAVNSNITGTFTGNTVTGDTATNPTPGTGFVSTTSGGSFNIRVGGPNAADGNVFSQLRGAGIAFALLDSGSGSFVIQNNMITSVIDDNDPNTALAGDGINVTLTGANSLASATATLTRSEISDNIIGDDVTANLGTNGSGITVTLTDDTTIQDLLIARNQIGNAGNDNSTAGAASNDAGIEFNRLGNGRLDAVNPRTGDLNAVILDGNIVRMSGQPVAVGVPVPTPGLSINVANGIRDDIDFDIRFNEFSGSTGDGVALVTQADASLAANMRGNLIENNTLNGIDTSGVEIVTNDLETQGGTWIQNTIRNNGMHGIQINAVSGTVIPMVIGQNGSDPFTGASFGNSITDNGLDGIEINSGGNVQILNNLIARNGTARNLALGNQFDSAGIDINAINIGSRTALIQNNVIQDNNGDGIELRAQGVASMTVVGLGNTIDRNAGRGVDLLVQSSAIGNVRFGDGTNSGMNRITQNGEEGFYVVTTASATQDQTANSAVALVPDGVADLFNTPDTVLDLDRNVISGNNISNANILNAFDGGGLSLRVGTSGSLTGPGFATSIADTTGDVFGDGSGFGSTDGVGANSDLFGNGRMNARVRNNTFEGNLGEDVYIQSFRSTVDPIAAAGTWDQNQFNVTAYQTDPLARLNLVFTGNTGNSIEVDEAGAFYNNGDGTFKSRLNTLVAPNVPGPFTSPTRRRNAERVAARGTGANALAPLAGPDFQTYQYPGMGASTFRLESDFDVSGFQSGDVFQIDGTPIPPTFNALGERLPGSIFGELGYGWGTVAPGTFQFDTPFIGVAP